MHVCTHCIHVCATDEARQSDYNILIFGVMATLMRVFFGTNLMHILRVNIRTTSFVNSGRLFGKMPFISRKTKKKGDF